MYLKQTEIWIKSLGWLDSSKLLFYKSSNNLNIEKSMLWITNIREVNILTTANPSTTLTDFYVNGAVAVETKSTIIHCLGDAGSLESPKILKYLCQCANCTFENNS